MLGGGEGNRNAIDMPWHLRPVGLILAFLNAIAALDWALCRWRDPAWLARLPVGGLRALYALPPAVALAWGLAVLGGLAGCGLLLIGSRLALWAFVASFAGLVVCVLWQAFVAPGVVQGAAPWALPVVAAEIAYARRLKRSRHLR
jgi:hypothetical protein